MNEDHPAMPAVSPPPTLPPNPAPGSPPPRYYPPPPAPSAKIKPIPHWVWITAAVLVLSVVAGSVPLYRHIVHDWHRADGLIAGIHTRMVAGDDAGIYSTADTGYQSAIGLQRSNKLFDYVRTQLGSPRAFTCTGQAVNVDSKNGEILTLTVSTVFDKGSGTETFKFHRSDGVYKLLLYKVLSPQIVDAEIPADLKSR
jgi:hypothetical protein